MAKIIKKFPWILILLLCIPAVFNLLRVGFFPMQDDLQAFRLYEMDKCFADLQIPCRWVPDAGYQYGYPQFNYYPPLPYYVGMVFRIFGIQYIDIIKILFILGYAASALAMYLLIKEVLDKYSGVVAALAYTYIPYKAVEVYVRGALSEFWAQIFFPLILWAIYKLIKTGKAKYILWLSLWVAALFSTHTLMSLIFAPVAAVWAIFWLFDAKWKNLGKTFIGAALGFGISAFFILPVLFERQFVHVESLLSGYFDYRQHFVNLYKLFVSREWGYGSSGFPNEKLNLSLGIIQWIVGLVLVPVAAILNFKKKKKLSVLIAVLFVLTLGSIFMIHMKSSFIWARLPFLWYMQFPWRFLAISIFLLCILCGFAVYFAGRFKYILGVIIVAASFTLTINFYVPKDWLNITDSDKFSGASWEKQLTISIFDYLPIYATLPPSSKAPELPEVIKGDVKFMDYRKGSNFQTGTVKVSEDATVRLPLFDFPGMIVKVDGKVTPHINNDCTGQRYCLGLIEFNIPSGDHTINAALTDTPVRKIGNILTLLSLGSLIAILIKLKK